jgi:TPP-dependent indolepyruvate ferredoxin oxidoreductase alpha subunit
LGEKKHLMGNLAITHGAVEAGVKIVAGRPGTPATETVKGFLDYRGIQAEWACNKKVAMEGGSPWYIAAECTPYGSHETQRHKCVCEYLDALELQRCERWIGGYIR